MQKRRQPKKSSAGWNVFEWQTEHAWTCDWTKTLTKISLITMSMDLFCFMCARNGMRPNEAEKNINKNASRWSGTWTVGWLALPCNPNAKWYILLHYNFSLLHFNLLLELRFYAHSWRRGDLTAFCARPVRCVCVILTFSCDTVSNQ